MSLAAQALQENNALAALTQRAGTQVTKAVETAAQKTGVDFGYLLKQADIESSFDTNAQAKTSSARGLYQFIESTWLEMVKAHGASHGINANQSKTELLKLRDNPDLAAKMAGEFAASNKAYLEKNWNGDVGATEQYLAHFMGAKGASDFLNTRDNDPNATASNLFPSAAKANKNIFYNSKDGQSRTLHEVYDLFDQKFATIKIIPAQETPEQATKSPVFQEYERLAAPYFQDLSRNHPLEHNRFYDLFSDNKKSALNQQKLWSMSSVDFLKLLSV